MPVLRVGWRRRQYCHHAVSWWAMPNGTKHRLVVYQRISIALLRHESAVCASKGHRAYWCLASGNEGRFSSVLGWAQGWPEVMLTLKTEIHCHTYTLWPTHWSRRCLVLSVKFGSLGCCPHRHEASLQSSWCDRILVVIRPARNEAQF